MHKTISRPSRTYMRVNSKGIALISVLWITTILGTILAVASYIIRLELRETNYFTNEIQLLNIASGGVEIAKSLLAKDKNNYDSLNEDWAKPITLKIDDITLSISITDEERKLNLNTAQKTALDKLSILNQSNELIDCLMDWIDEDSLTRNNGAEQNYYKYLAPSIYCKNKYLDSIDELYLIKGFNTKLVNSLKNIAAVNSNGKININTASIEVLLTLPGITDSLAQNIISYRTGKDSIDGTPDDKPFSNIYEINSIINTDVFDKIRNKITVISNNFKIIVTASRGKYIKKIETVISKSGNNMKIKYWREF
jgi:general secretion pathway protein K